MNYLRKARNTARNSFKTTRNTISNTTKELVIPLKLKLLQKIML